MKHLKLSVAIALLYTGFFNTIIIVPYLVHLIFIYMDIALLNYMLKSKRNRKLGTINVLLISFYSVALITGLLISFNTFTFISNIAIGIQYAVLFITTYLIVRDTRSIDYIFKLLLFIGMLNCFYSFFFGVEVRGRLTISENSNANTLAIWLYYSYISLIYFFNRGVKYKLLTIIYIPISLMVLFESGSKKGLLATLLFLLGFGMLNLLRKRKFNPLKSIISIGIIVLVIFVMKDVLTNLFLESTLFSRLSDMGTSQTDIIRKSLYMDALTVFKENPIFGVGYQNFTYISTLGLYSHSLYMELLSGTGLVGTTIWGLMYFSIFLKASRNYMNFKDKTTTILLTIYFVHLFLDSVLATIYNPFMYVSLAVISGYHSNLSLKNRLNE